MTKTYSTKSNAVRAARTAGMATFTIDLIDGRFALTAGTAPKAIRRVSKIPGPCDTVAMICRANAGASRKELMGICEKAGIAYYTARTQIQRHMVRVA